MKFTLQPQYTLEPWQKTARDSWLNCSSLSLGARHGILSMYTGAGKTVVALAALCEVAKESPGMKYAIVVPTTVLAHQWKEKISKVTTLPQGEVGIIGDGHSDDFCTHTVLVIVLASARKKKKGTVRLAKVCTGYDVTLIVDECHRTGSPISAKIYEAKTKYRLGLSATPIRENDLDENGLTMPLIKQEHGKCLGDICYEISLKDGYEQGLLPRYEIHHHGLVLSPDERAEYNVYSDDVRTAQKDFKKVCNQHGLTNKHYLRVIQRPSGIPQDVFLAAQKLQTLLLARKSFLYNLKRREEVARFLIQNIWSESPPAGLIIFNERIGGEQEDYDKEDNERKNGAISLFQTLQHLAISSSLFSPENVAIEHSELSSEERLNAVNRLRTGDAQILVSVKALQEGLDIPDVGMGLSVASTSSVRQRIQTMGRILRRPRDHNGRPIDPNQAPVKQLHMIYIANTTDEAIYRKEDWSDETGNERNHWWIWPHDSNIPIKGSPLIPEIVSEEKASEMFQETSLPQVWNGPIKGRQFSYKWDSIHSSGDQKLDREIIQKLISRLDSNRVREALRWDSGEIGHEWNQKGKFVITPKENVVLKLGKDPDAPHQKRYWAIGKLDKLNYQSNPEPKKHTQKRNKERLQPTSIHGGNKKMKWYELWASVVRQSYSGTLPTQVIERAMRTRKPHANLKKAMELLIRYRTEPEEMIDIRSQATTLLRETEGLSMAGYWYGLWTRVICLLINDEHSAAQNLISSNRLEYRKKPKEPLKSVLLEICNNWTDLDEDSESEEESVEESIRLELSTVLTRQNEASDIRIPNQNSQDLRSKRMEAIAALEDYEDCSNVDEFDKDIFDWVMKVEEPFLLDRVISMTHNITEHDKFMRRLSRMMRL